MNQNTRIVVGVVFLILSITAISLFRINPAATTPTRSTQTRTAGIMKGLTQDVVITQELSAIKDYLRGVELIFTHAGRRNTSRNTLLLLNKDYDILYEEKFSSTRVKEGDLTTFLFDKSYYIGKGNRFYICLHSDDGTPDDCVSLLFNQSDSIGPLWLSVIKDNDLIGAVKSRQYFYQGSLMFRTFASDSSQFWLMKGFLYFLATVISCLIVWFKWVRAALAKTRIVPEWIFVAIALPVSVVFSIITPPLQVPDEGSHFLKSNEIAEFNLFSKNKTGPVSILNLDSTFQRLHFSAGEKTSKAEIKQHFNVKLEPGKRATISPPGYAFPYLPQALGILLGKIFGSSPLMLMYLGRLFNLLAAVVVMFFAIRIIPEFKWIFLLLALMPKTLFLFGSLSYDSLTISLSFLTIAVFFHYAYACERNLNLKDLALMGLLVLLLLLCKPPYFILGLLFFFIPPKKFGVLYKYVMISLGVVILGLVIFTAGPLATKYFAASNPVQQMAQASTDAGNDLPLIRPDEQIQVILKDIPGYLKLIIKSGFDTNRPYILESFVGLLGWIDVELPDFLSYSYLCLILVTALILAGNKVTFSWDKRAILIFMLAFAYLVIQTAMYVYATRPGRDQVFGVQGRYFIPMAPVFFMLFYNRYLNPGLNLLFSLRRKDYKSAKPKARQGIYEEIMDREQLFNKAWYLFLALFCSFTLLYSIYITLIRYYNI